MTKTYVPGDLVTFRDANAVGGVLDRLERVCEGVVNGPVMDVPGMRYVPVWAERVGREATTILVAESNILSVEKTKETDR